MIYDVITIGTATRDVFLKSSVFKAEIKNPKELKRIGIQSSGATCLGLGSKIGIEEPIFEIGGAAINAAVTFSRQGYKTAAFFKVGGDEAGKSIIKRLKEEKIINLGITDKKLKTAYSTILLSPNSERTILTYRGTSQKIKNSEIPFNKFKSKWAYISSSNIDLSLVKKITDHFYDQGTLIAMNPSSAIIKMGIKKIAPILKKTKVLIINREEASYLTKIDYNDKKVIFKKLDEAVGGIFIMTDGEKGAWISDNNNLYQIRPFKDERRLDRTGAGDSFGSGFISGLMRKRGKILANENFGIDCIEYASRLALANSTSNLEQIGAETGILTKKEFETGKKWKNLKIKVTKLANRK